VHLRATDSTNLRARALALRGAPNGTLVTAASQSAGRGRQGRTWTAPPGRALLCSLVLREPPPLLPLTAGVAVAEVCGAEARIKWPNDVLVGAGKVAGILVEGRLQEHWAVLGIGVNVAIAPDQFPEELRGRAATLGLTPEAIEPTLSALLVGLEGWLAAAPEAVLDAARARDALLGQPVRWAGGEGVGAGIDGDGRLLVSVSDMGPGGAGAGGGTVALDAGEVHLGSPSDPVKP
jgi:BirA family transcriptional regulator, biotin operon repressor / biotin---[acetyl-CoA-carboxylase] ligase